MIDISLHFFSPSQILANKKNQHMGLVIFGADDTKNSLAEDEPGQYQHIVVLNKLAPVRTNDDS